MSRCGTPASSNAFCTQRVQPTARRPAQQRQQSHTNITARCAEQRRTSACANEPAAPPSRTAMFATPPGKAASPPHLQQAVRAPSVPKEAVQHSHVPPGHSLLLVQPLQSGRRSRGQYEASLQTQAPLHPAGTLLAPNKAAVCTPSVAPHPLSPHLNTSSATACAAPTARQSPLTWGYSSGGAQLAQPLRTLASSAMP